MKPSIILDLDATLICSEELPSFNFMKYKQKMNLFEYEFMENLYVVFERPDLQDFLDFLFDNFQVSVWTAATKSYALFIINKIIFKRPGRKLDYILFNYHVKLSKKLGKGTKDLSLLWSNSKFELEFDKDKTLILDDNEEVFNTQKCNTLVAKPFDFEEEGSENDTFLKDLQPRLLELKKQIEAGETKDKCLVE